MNTLKQRTQNGVTRSTITILAILMGCCLYWSCQKSTVLYDSAAMLSFSKDSLYLDTIITRIGSPTQDIMVYNHNSKALIIDKVTLAMGQESEFVFNINGITQAQARNLRIEAGDSMYIFMQAKLKKNNHDTLALHSDKLQFSFNNKTQELPVVSWGRDAEFIYGKTITSTTWTAGHSYLILDSLIIAKDNILTIDSGVTVYFEPKANLSVEGSLVVQGTKTKPVVFQGHR